MKISRALADVAREVSADQVLAYLQLSGWQPESVEPGLRSLWSKQAVDNAFTVMVPLDPTFADYEARLVDALATIQRVADLADDELLTAIGATRLDVIRIRAVQETGPGGSILLSEGRELIEGAYNMLRAGAATTVRRKARIGTRQPRHVDNFVKEARLGQTEAGSYTITLLTPLAEAESPEQDQLVAPTPFAREVTEHLAKALAAAKRASDSFVATEDFSDFVEAVADGVSAELCEAVAEMVASADAVAEVDITFDWAPVGETAPTTPDQVNFSRNYVEPLRRASARFRETDERRDQSVRGLVEGLNRPPGAGEGVVVLVRTDAEIGKKVRFRLRDADFDAAADALKSHAYVRCRGDVVREGNYTWLHNLTQFRVETQILESD